MEDVNRKSAELLNALTKEHSRYCFDQWKKLMERSVARGVHLAFDDRTIFKNKTLFHEQSRYLIARFRTYIV